MIKSTHTYAILEISQAAYNEIKSLLEKAGYDHVFHEDTEFGIVMDMHGIALGAVKDSVEPLGDLYPKKDDSSNYSQKK